ncbi:flagellum-specific ATP synthase [Marinicauda pacifica]|uniref:Flagellum-specific ATP synthase n=1 Tax=Marinicauda pacifica TaxID=1133559 RepID=A0A4S2H996_9PROT|nr:flagellar protein export ATPase FliI [Marinicauda pacifica]TGY92002.1 flagellar protein export ATPase FliI [Marinicauda pacifica]GGE45136.1 flagellum-specific ATP synthase [Marinicauda pacifica]
MDTLIDRISAIETRTFKGRVSAVNGLLVEAKGPEAALTLGARATIRHGDSEQTCEVVGFRGETALMMSFGNLNGIRAGAEARLDPEPATVRPHASWLGRVMDGAARPVDGGGPLAEGEAPYPLRGEPPCAHSRARLGDRLDLGVRALNIFAPMRKGQRLGIFAGSGVGKSVLMSMLAKGSSADVIVIGLIGERGREAREFVEDTLGPDGRAKAVVVTETSDSPALARRQAAYLTMSVAEYFRDQGLNVLCLMDSVTRFALAQREIGLAAGEPPTTRGYTPSVFAELPRLLERAGPGPEGSGTITALFTVLVDGDDHNEPIADAVRGILDGHVVMSRAIAERGRFPAIDVLKSISRTAPEVYAPEEVPLARQARKVLAAYADMEELIRLGAYTSGSNPEVDRAIAVNEPLETLLAQGKDEAASIEESFAALASILVDGKG